MMAQTCNPNIREREREGKGKGEGEEGKGEEGYHKLEPARAIQ